MATPMSGPFVATGSGWLRGLRIYLGSIAIGNLVWESLQLPLYTVWETGTLSAQAFAVIHCTVGDVLIALSALVLALLLTGDEYWPASRFRQVVVLAIVFGLAYTAFSEWLNVVVRASWAYSERMPLLSLLEHERDPHVWKAAVRSLALLGTPDALTGLARLALVKRSFLTGKGCSVEQRTEVVRALAQIHGQGVRATLERIARETEEPVRSEAMRALQEPMSAAG